MDDAPRRITALATRLPLFVLRDIFEFVRGLRPARLKVTHTKPPRGTSVILPPGLPVAGEILTSHIRNIDTLARPMLYAGAAIGPVLAAEVLAAEVLAAEIRAKLEAFIAI